MRYAVLSVFVEDDGALDIRHECDIETDDAELWAREEIARDLGPNHLDTARIVRREGVVEAWAEAAGYAVRLERYDEDGSDTASTS